MRFAYNTTASNPAEEYSFNIKLWFLELEISRRRALTFKAPTPPILVPSQKMPAKPTQPALPTAASTARETDAIAVLEKLGVKTGTAKHLVTQIASQCPPQWDAQCIVKEALRRRAKP